MVDSTAVANGGAYAGLPAWTLWFAFIASAVLALLRLAEVIIATSKRAVLEIRLTREAFLRLLPNDGECIYLNVVCLARNGTALIEDVEATLKRISGSAKAYTLTFRNLGQKHINNDGTVNYAFQSPSPLLYLQNNVPMHLAWILNISEYSQALVDKYGSFFRECNGIMQGLPPSMNDIVDPDESLALLAKVRTLCDQSAVDMMNSVQVEAGQYQVDVVVHYSQKVLWRSTRHQSKASLSFQITATARSELKSSLDATLPRMAAGALFPTQPTGPIAAPEVVFTSTSEAR